LFALGGYFAIDGAIGLGRMQNYQPVQPIYYSHTVHAGTNQISCLYCHGTAQDSKHAGIPSVNVCMNCHKSIAKYEGPDKLEREDGTAVNGTAEIEKLYEYAGWDPIAKEYKQIKIMMECQMGQNQYSGLKYTTCLTTFILIIANI
jgi:hypothetical protein